MIPITDEQTSCMTLEGEALRSKTLRSILDDTVGAVPGCPEQMREILAEMAAKGDEDVIKLQIVMLVGITPKLMQTYLDELAQKTTLTHAMPPSVQ